MSIIDLTSGVAYATVSAAIQGSAAGDVIALDAGSYVENFPKITHALTLQGRGGLAALSTPGSPANGQGVLVIRSDVVLRNLDISGAVVPDQNGAGIRVEIGSLVLEDSRIHHNQDGILANPGAGSVTIRRSEIDHNGAGDGLSHNIYIGDIAAFTLQDSYVHDAAVGNEVKSRAQTTVITGNRIQDQAGDASYSIDLPSGRQNTVTGNVLQKGADTQNVFFIHFGGELFPTPSGSSLTVSGNTFLNQMPAGTATYGVLNDTNAGGSATPASITGNTFYGFETGAPNFDVRGPPDVLSANVFLPASAAPALSTGSPFAVPEPGTLALVLLAVAALRLVSPPAGAPWRGKAAAGR